MHFVQIFLKQETHFIPLLYLQSKHATCFKIDLHYKHNTK